MLESNTICRKGIFMATTEEARREDRTARLMAALHPEQVRDLSQMRPQMMQRTGEAASQAQANAQSLFVACMDRFLSNPRLSTELKAQDMQLVDIQKRVKAAEVG